MNNVTNSYFMNQKETSSIESCDILNDPDSLMSTAYLPSQRIKKFKPQTPLQDGNKYEYCYIDNDVRNGIQDYIMKDRECSKSDPLFASPFIESVYSDNNLENTRKFPYEKCIIKIDKEQVNRQEIKNFWDRIGTTECSRLFDEVLKENAKITNNVKTCNNEVTRLKKEFENKKQTINNLLNDTIPNLDRQITSCMRTQSVLVEDKNNALRDSMKWNKLFKEDETKCKTELSYLKNKADSCDVELENLKKLYNKKQDDYHRLYKRYVVLKEKKTALESAYSNLQTQYSNILETKKALEEEYRKVYNSYVICMKELKVCTSTLSQCTKERERIENDLKRILKLLDECNQAHNKCKTSLLQTNENIGMILKEIERMQPLYNTCRIELENCRKKLQELLISKENMRRLLEDVFQNKSECFATIAEIENIDKELKDVLELCKMDIERKNEYTKAVMRVNEKKFEESNKQLAVCKNNQGMPTSYATITEQVKPNKIPPMTFKREIKWYPFTGDPYWSTFINPEGKDLSVGRETCKKMCEDNPECTHYHVGDGKCFLRKADKHGNITFRDDGYGRFFYPDPANSENIIEVPFHGHPSRESLAYHNSKIREFKTDFESCGRYCKFYKYAGFWNWNRRCQCFADYKNIIFKNERQSGEIKVVGSAPPDFHGDLDKIV